MATFGPISSANPNVLFDPARAMGAAQEYKANALMMQNRVEDRDEAKVQREREEAGRFAAAALERPEAERKEFYERGMAAFHAEGRMTRSPVSFDAIGSAGLERAVGMLISPYQREQLKAKRAEVEALAEYRTGMLGVQQGRLGLSAARGAGGGGGRARSDDDDLTFVPIGAAAPAPAPAAPAGGGPRLAPAPPAGPQMGQAAPAPEISGPAQRAGGVDVAGPGAPPAAPADPAGPPPGTRLMLRKGVPITTGLGEGQAWGVDPSGMRIPVDIPGARRKPAEEPAGPIGGNGLDSALMNILIKGDPSSPQYAAAFARLGAEEVMNNGVTRRPDMSPFRQPTYRPPGVMEPAPGGSGAAAPGAAPAIPSGGRSYGEVTVKPSGQMSPEATTAVRKAEAEVGKVTSAIDRFEQVFSDQGGTSLSAYMNNPTSADAVRLNTAFDNLQMALRGEAFMNTGVLQPHEMKMLRESLLAPQSLRGLAATPAAMKAKMEELRGYIRAGLEAQRQAAGATRATPGPGGRGSAEPPARQPPPPRPGEVQDGYRFKGGDPSNQSSWEKAR